MSFLLILWAISIITNVDRLIPGSSIIILNPKTKNLSVFTSHYHMEMTIISGRFPKQGEEITLELVQNDRSSRIVILY